MATIKDIARQLNISTSTVSYALNGGPRQVPEAVRDRVLAMARELNYRPNSVARSLVTGRTGALGVVADGQGNWVHALVEQGRRMGEDLLFIHPAAGAVSEVIALNLLDGRVDGVLLTGENPDRKIIDMLAELQFPCVLLGSERDGPSYTVSLRSGIERAMEHLVSLGHMRIANLMSPLDLPSAQEQEETFRDCLLTHSLDLIPGYLLEGPATLEAGYQAGKKLLSLTERPTAIIAGSSSAAFGVCRAAAEIGVEIPKDLSVVSIGGSPLSEAFQPALTTISVPYAEMATAALKALIALSRSQEPPASQKFEATLIERGSTGRATRAPITLKRFDRDRLRGLS
ncbi:MAG: LacI family DNA-binding transcriptional regulator [Fimbriimonas sp.]